MHTAVDPSIVDELCLLAASLLLGIALMVLYDVIRLFRTLIRQGFWAVAVEDALFWVVSSIAIFILLFVFNEGRIRFYALLAVGLGMLSYYALIGKRWPPYIRKKLQKHQKSAESTRNSRKEVAKKKESR